MYRIYKDFFASRSFIERPHYTSPSPRRHKFPTINPAFVTIPHPREKPYIMKIQGFPSLLETSYGKLPQTSSNFINGMRLRYQDNWYILGNECRNQGRNPHRLINASPEEPDYGILYTGALSLACRNSNEKFVVTTGFPQSVYNSYRGMAEKFLAQRYFTVEVDTSTYKKDGIVEKRNVEVEHFEVIPELTACAIGLKRHYKVPEEHFLLVSLGFGTAEIGVVSNEGINKRTIISIPGMIQCIRSLRDELEKENVTGFMTEHQLDDAFVKGSLILNRKVINISSLRDNIIRAYYKGYISDTIRSQVSDRDFERIEKIYIVGGGIHHPEMQNCFHEEFDKFTKLDVVDEPDTVAAYGYYYNSVKLSNSNATTPLGIDLGNSSTIVCFNDEQ